MICMGKSILVWITGRYINNDPPSNRELGKQTQEYTQKQKQRNSLTSNTNSIKFQHFVFRHLYFNEESDI